MSLPRCFLHVGCPKTGTTYLQTVMWRSRAQLAEQGLVLPLRGQADHFFITLALRGRLDPTYDQPRAFDVLERLERALGTTGSSDVVISHELLAPLRPKQAERLLAMLGGFEVHVVVTARDLVRQIPAEWQQHLKTRSVASYEEFLGEVRDRTARHFWSVQDVPDVAARWGAGLPPSRVHIVTVPPPGSPPTLLVDRYFSVLGVDPASLDTTPTRSNPSLGYPQSELLRRVNQTLGERLPHPRAGYNVAVKTWFAESVLAGQPGPRLALPAEHAGWCAETSQQMVSRLEERGYDVSGDLQDLLVEPAGDGSAAAAPGDAELLAVALESLATMVTQRGEEALALKRERAARQRARDRRRRSRPAPDEPAAAGSAGRARRGLGDVVRRLGGTSRG